MILGIGAESGIFLYAGLAGMTVLCTYYILICFRKLIRHSNLAAGIEDVIFWIAASIYIFSGKCMRQHTGVSGGFLCSAYYVEQVLDIFYSAC